MRGVYENRREFLASQFVSDVTLNPQNIQDDEYTILAGPFAGVKYKKEIINTGYAGDTELTQKIFGLYEQEILDFIQVSCFDTLIDIGAGGGYYGIGLLAKEKISKAFFYEIDDYRSSHISINAGINNIQGDKIFLRKSANASAILNDIDNNNEQISKTLIICDIEGWECELFTESFLKNLKQKNVSIILEYHPHIIKKIKHYEPDYNLINLLENYYEIKTLNNMERDIKDKFLFAPLVNDRWLLISELRAEGISLLL